jgi:hypothetical protein
VTGKICKQRSKTKLRKLALPDIVTACDMESFFCIAAKGPSNEQILALFNVFLYMSC